LFFNNDKKFKEFAKFMDMPKFVKQLKDHELSLIFHANYEYSFATVDRTQNLFKDGIDVRSCPHYISCTASETNPFPISHSTTAVEIS